MDYKLIRKMDNVYLYQTDDDEKLLLIKNGREYFIHFIKDINDTNDYNLMPIKLKLIPEKITINNE